VVIGDILQPTHLIFILVVALLVLGPKRLPEVGRSLGKGIRDFRGALSGLDEHTSMTPTETQVDEPVTPATTSLPSDAAPVHVSTSPPSAESVPQAVSASVSTNPVDHVDTVALDSEALAVAEQTSAPTAPTAPTAPAVPAVRRGGEGNSE
jgi:TatA/E family protein of Tat protein translocase